MIKLRYNTDHLRWAAPCLFLALNICFLGVKPDDEIVSLICIGISINLSAVLTCVLLCIFPRTYYCFDEDGITYYSRKGELKWGVLWRDVTAFSYFIWGIIDPMCAIEYHKGDGKDRKKTIHISYRQYRKVYNELNLKDKINVSKNQNNF